MQREREREICHPRDHSPHGYNGQSWVGTQLGAGSFFRPRWGCPRPEDIFLYFPRTLQKAELQLEQLDLKNSHKRCVTTERGSTCGQHPK